jgi:hypothetical protein
MHEMSPLPMINDHDLKVIPEGEIWMVTATSGVSYIGNVLSPQPAITMSSENGMMISLTSYDLTSIAGDDGKARAMSGFAGKSIFNLSTCRRFLGDAHDGDVGQVRMAMFQTKSGVGTVVSVAMSDDLKDAWFDAGNDFSVPFNFCWEDVVKLSDKYLPFFNIPSTLDASDFDPEDLKELLRMKRDRARLIAMKKDCGFCEVCKEFCGHQPKCSSHAIKDTCDCGGVDVIDGLLAHGKSDDEEVFLSSGARPKLGLQIGSGNTMTVTSGRRHKQKRKQMAKEVEREQREAQRTRDLARGVVVQTFTCTLVDDEANREFEKIRDQVVEETVMRTQFDKMMKDYDEMEDLIVKDAGGKEKFTTFHNKCMFRLAALRLEAMSARSSLDKISLS